MMKKIFKTLIWVAIITVIASSRNSIFSVFNIESTNIEKYLNIFFGVLLWISYAVLVNKMLVVFIWEGLLAKNRGEVVPKLLQEIASVILSIITIGFIMSYVFKKSLTGLWATSGIISVVLGFALKGMLSDIFAGIAINMERPFRLGDWIEVQGRNASLNVIGEVKEVNWRTTRLLSPQKNHIIISNNNISMMTIINYSRPKNRCRFQVSITLDFSIPIERAKRLLLSGVKVATETKGFYKDPAPEVFIKDISDVGIVYQVRYWVIPWKGISAGAAKDAVMYNIIRNLHKAGINMVFPTKNIQNIGEARKNKQVESRQDRKILLSKVKLFSRLNDEELDMLAGSSEPEYYISGDLVIEKGSEGDSVIILLEGMLEVFSHAHDGKKEIKLATLKSGDFFGEMSFFTGAPRSANVKAGTDVCLIKIHKEVMDKLLHNRPKIVEHISEVIAERSLENSKKVEDMSLDKQIAETNRLSRQILVKIKSFFKIF